MHEQVMDYYQMHALKAWCEGMLLCMQLLLTQHVRTAVENILTGSKP